jgi:hypothetical protein
LVPPITLRVVAVMMVVSALLVVHNDLGGVPHGVAAASELVVLLLELAMSDATLLKIVPGLFVVAVEATTTLRAGRVVRGDGVAVGRCPVAEVLCRAISALEKKESTIISHADRKRHEKRHGKRGAYTRDVCQ